MIAIIILLLSLLCTSCGVMESNEVSAEDKAYINVLERSQQFDRLVSYYTRRNEVEPSDNNVYGLVRALYLSGDIQPCLVFSKKLDMKIDRNLNIKARCLMLGGQYEKANILLEKSIFINSENSETFHLLGLVYAQSRNYKIAMRAFNKSKYLLNRNWQLTNDIAMLNILVGDYPKAINTLSELSYEQTNDNEKVRNNLMVALAKIGDIDSFKKIYTGGEDEAKRAFYTINKRDTYEIYF